MEPEESFYRQEVVYWSCLRNAMISNNFGRENDREKYRLIADGRRQDKEKRTRAYHISVPIKGEKILWARWQAGGSASNLDLSKQSTLVI